MPRIRKTKTPVTETKESNWLLYIIVLLLIFQTVFLIYKNYDFIRSGFLSNDTEYIYENAGVDEDNSQADTNSIKTTDYSDLDRPVRVSILNGCGKSGLASEWKTRLRNIKYDIRETGNADKNYINSIILSRIKNMKPAFDLAKKLGITDNNVILQINKDIVDIDVTLIIGKDYKNLK
ncbi:MAG: LytR C-terminal domain-containing protein [Candidatus Delongbacteria bacterium]|nr:LytR C-terminal domain-containing protein [Candidatus Delongbacteria bacterium]